MKNLELKLKLNSFESIEKKLTVPEIKFSGTIKQKDIYFKFSGGLLKLRIQSDGYRLIKYKRNECVGERWSNYDILRLEGENPELFLREILITETVIDKVRRVFMYKNTRIHLDDVANLGKFLELESLVVSDQAEAAKEFDEISEILELDNSNEIRKSYRDIMLEQL